MGRARRDASARSRSAGVVRGRRWARGPKNEDEPVTGSTSVNPPFAVRFNAFPRVHLRADLTPIVPYGGLMPSHEREPTPASLAATLASTRGRGRIERSAVARTFGLEVALVLGKDERPELADNQVRVVGHFGLDEIHFTLTLSDVFFDPGNDEAFAEAQRKLADRRQGDFH